jgi:hypothetical protein
MSETDRIRFGFGQRDHFLIFGLLMAEKSHSLMEMNEWMTKNEARL